MHVPSAAAVLWSVALAACLGCWPASASGQTRFEAPRVVAFADVHGAYDALAELLVQAGITDPQMHWRGGATHLVSLGDYLDRGPDSRKVMDLLRRLDQEAAAAGGRVHVLLGNHELMNLTGDLRYVSAGEFAAFATRPTANGISTSSSSTSSNLAGGDVPVREHPAGYQELRKAFAADGPYGAWLLQRPATVVINDTVFVHGGLPPLTRTLPPEQLNSRLTSRLTELVTLHAELERAGVLPAGLESGDAAVHLRTSLEHPDAPLQEPWRQPAERFIDLSGEPLLGEHGPLWYRGTALCHPLLESPVLTATLEAWDARRVVVGHTPTPDHRVRARLDGRAILADTGMLASHYRGVASAVVLEGGRLQVVYANRAEPDSPDVVDEGLMAPLPDSAVLATLADASFDPGPDDSAVLLQPLPGAPPISARFEPANRRATRAELAAYRLDAHLGLHLIAPVVAREVAGRKGVVTALWPDAYTEAERAARALAPAEPCTAGTTFELLFAFDALIGNQGRTADNVHYHPTSGRLASTGHGASFGRGGDLPSYLARSPRRLPPALASALKHLDEATLQTVLGDLLSSAQIRALLARRDTLMQNWQTGG